MPYTIFEALRESHKIQRSLIRKLMLSKTDAHRNDVFQQLRIELAAHEASEERFLYAQILMDDRGLHASRDALHDHHEMDEIVEDLQKRDQNDHGWLATVKNLSAKLHEHLREEEKIFFQISGKILSESAKLSLAIKYKKDYLAMHTKLAAT